MLVLSWSHVGIGAFAVLLCYRLCLKFLFRSCPCWSEGVGAVAVGVGAGGIGAIRVVA